MRFALINVNIFLDNFGLVFAIWIFSNTFGLRFAIWIFSIFSTTSGDDDPTLIKSDANFDIRKSCGTGVHKNSAISMCRRAAELRIIR